MRRFVVRVAALFRGARADAEFDREIAAHRALLEDEYRRRGMTREDAALAARRAMGSIPLARDWHRDARSFVWIEDLRRDLGYALRSLRRTPGFALLAIVALALGIGVNTTFFTIVNAICLRGLPIDSPGRVMYLSTLDAQNRPGSLSYAEFDELRARLTTIERVAAYTITVASLADDRQPPSRVPGAYISAGAFEVIGDKPIAGRTFRADEDRPGSAPVVIIGEELWSSRYARDPAIVGRSIRVNGTPSTVIGIMPRGFRFPANANVWRPMANLPGDIRASRTERRLAVFARLKDGATQAQARVEAEGIGVAWQREWPAANRDVRVHLVPINEQLNPDVMQRAWLAFITAGMLVLLVACANVANLLLMRAAGRGREMAIRTSIGATRGRVVRQVLVEGAALAGIAGGLGVFVAWAGLRALSGIVPPETLPYWMAFTIDIRVLAVTAVVCLGCVFLCGLPSALNVSKINVRDALAESAPAAAGVPARRWITGLLAAEFAVTMVLVAIAVMSMRTNIESRQREFQIDPAPLLTLWLTLPSDSYSTPAVREGFFNRLDERLADSGLGSAAFASVLPYGGGPQLAVAIDDRPRGDTPSATSVVTASERYFAVLGIPLRRGRAFTAFDGRPGSEAAIVNERFVRMFLPDLEPIGTRIRLGRPDSPWLQIVGVATTVRQQVIGPEPDPVVFLPFRPSPSQTTAMIVRTARDPTTLVAQLRRHIAQLDPNLPLYRVMPFEQSVLNAVWNGRLSDTIVRSIATVALLLALIGIYAVTGYTVRRWTRELGMRLALGAQTHQVAWLVLRRVLTQVGIGLAFGVAGVVAFDRVFTDPATASVTHVRMTDPPVMAAIGVAILAIAVVACLVPIRRAARLDPVEALRT